MYELFLEKNVIKFLSKLNKDLSKRIFGKIETLRINPTPSDSKRLVNVKDKVFRIRVGDYRVLYRIEGNTVVIVFLIDKRSRVYNR
ncbi:MAG: type II toxin-antitoxin system RelE family toxin [Candidatus Woesearchaeota archaeon]